MGESEYIKMLFTKEVTENVSWWKILVYTVLFSIFIIRVFPFETCAMFCDFPELAPLLILESSLNCFY